MHGILKSKSGVSPLIATILLIAFAVSLGSVVMNWGLNLGKGDDKCYSTIVRIREVNGAQICIAGSSQNSYLNFIMDNLGTTDISGFTILMVGEKGTKLFDLDATIKRGALYDKSDDEITYDYLAYGNLKKVQFLPKIKNIQDTEVCTKSAVEADKIGNCA